MIQDVFLLSKRFMERRCFTRESVRPFITVYTPRGMHTFHLRGNDPYQILPAVVISRHLLDATEVYCTMNMEIPAVKSGEIETFRAMVIYGHQSQLGISGYKVVDRQLAWFTVNTETLVMDKFIIGFLAACHEPLPDGLTELKTMAAKELDPWQTAFELIADRMDVDLAKSCNSFSAS